MGGGHPGCVWAEWGMALLPELSRFSAPARSHTQCSICLVTVAPGQPFRGTSRVCSGGLDSILGNRRDRRFTREQNTA